MATLHDAAWYGFPEVIKLLTRHGADPKAQSEDGYIALHCAVHECHTECVRVLLQYDADLDLQNSKGRKPLHTAARSGYTAIVELLLDAGADINAVGKSGCTALFYAASNGKDETLDCLLDHGADTEIKKPKPAEEENGEPISVFDIAKSNGHKTTLAILNAHVQGERKPKKRPTLSSESSQPDQSSIITDSHTSQNPEIKITTSPSSTPSETTYVTGLKYPPPPPLVRPAHSVSAPGFPPAPGPAAAPLYTQPAAAAYVPSVQVSVSPPQTFTTQPNLVQAGFFNPANAGNIFNIAPTPPPRPASSALPYRPHPSTNPMYSQPTTATAPVLHTQFPPLPPPPPYSPTAATTTIPQSSFPSSPHFTPHSPTYHSPAPPVAPQIYQPYQGYHPSPPTPQPTPQMGSNPSFLTPQPYNPQQYFAPPPTYAFPVNSNNASPGYIPGQVVVPGPHVHQVKRSKSLLDFKIMGKQIL